jgi:hypothetical protein
MPDVRLVDLEVIKRFSLAVRRDTVPAEELLEAIDASRAVVVAALLAGSTDARPAKTPRQRATRVAKAPAATAVKKAPNKTVKKAAAAVPRGTGRRGTR